MKQLNIGEEVLFAERIIKNQNSIIGYTNEIKVFEFQGVTDFTQFQLEEGQEWDIEINEVEELKQALAELTILISMGGI